MRSVVTQPYQPRDRLSEGPILHKFLPKLTNHDHSMDISLDSAEVPDTRNLIY